jgi:hypothetical protein
MLFIQSKKLLFPGLRDELEAAVGYRGHGGLGQGFDRHEPLFGDHGLHHGPAAVAVADRMAVVLHFFEQPVMLQVF